jgi:HEAT repeat protein
MNHRLLVPLAAVCAALTFGQCAPAQAAARKIALKEKYIPNQPTAPSPTLADGDQLRNVGISPDGNGLLDFFRLRSAGKPTQEKLVALVGKLSDKDAAVRNKACAELIAYGPVSIPLLRQASKDVDAVEACALAKRCLQALEHDSASISAAAVRELAKAQPAGTIEVLLDFLPDAEDQSVLDDVKATLHAIITKSGKTDPALLKALEDKLALRRAFAVEVLTQNGQAEPRAVLRKLLADPSASVRLRAALALGQAREAKAVSTLIALLGDLPSAQARLAEEFLQGLAEDQAPKVALGEDEAGRIKCRDEWAKWWLSTEGAKLLDELKMRTMTEETRDKIAKLIDKLGDDSFDVRQKAEKELKAMKSLVIPLLKAAMSNPDLEVRQRAQTCLNDIEKDKSVPLSPVVPKLIALRKPAGAVEALLNYIPNAADDGIAMEAQNALNAVAYTDGKANPILVKALGDTKIAARRAAAAEALCGEGVAEHLPAIRKLLKDTDANVRMKVALALCCVKEKDAMPVLIASLPDVNADQAVIAEEYLFRVAGDKAPSNMPAGDGDRAKRRDAWAKWWETEGTKVVLLDRKAVDEVSRFLGYTLLVSANTNSVSELDSGGKQRWNITGLLGPQDAQVLRGDRVLIAEYNGQRVTERNFKGEILWQKNVSNWPMMAQRLHNGNTFIVMRNMLIEVDRNGKEVQNINRPFSDVMSAHKLRDGQIVIVSNQQTVIWMDKDGKELRNYRIQGVSNFGNDVMANGHVIVPISWQNRVIEYDKEGKVVWEKNVTQPMSAFRLPNGNTMVATQQWPAKVYEIDKDGKQVAEVTPPNYIIRAKKR